MSMCCVTSVLNVAASMDSTIMIGESDGEVIDLDSSCDNSKIICLNDNSIYESTNDKGRFSPTEDAGANNEIHGTTSIDVGGRDMPLARSDDDAPQPIFKVMFRDGNVSRQYRRQIKEFLQTLLAKESKLSYEEDIDASSLILDVWDNKDSFKDQVSSINLENVNIGNKVVSDNKGESSDIRCDSLFMIDTQPKLMDDLDVPTYGKKYEETSDSETLKDVASRTKCFNCMGNHSLRNCQLPRNQANINKNRKEFSMRYMRLGVRYHLNEEQKFGHMIPGQLSQNLRAALGLRDNELPKHIYRMRLLGYPPGWLEEARLQHSGLSLFNSDGVAEADPNDETGEISTDVNRDRYDLKKIYDFPGFNIPPPPGITDESHKFRAPQMQSVHSKEAMLLLLQGKEIDAGYKRKKMKLSTSINTSSEVISSEMDIEDVEESAVENVPINGHFVPPLPKETLPPPPPPPVSSTIATTGLNEIVEDSDSQSRELPFSDSADDTATPSSRANSPSLSELENIKKQLLVELEETSSQSNPDASLKNNLNTTITSDTPLSNSSPTLQNLNTSQGSIKSIDLGTPILQSISAYNKLPASEKFSRNICDILNFENLPDSTGKYEEMTGVLQKVRDTMTRLHQV